MDSQPNTNVELLLRLKKSPNNTDWEIFFKQYDQVILRFCRTLGLDDAGARDVRQETMLLLMRKLPHFNYDPATGRFRNWLFKLAAGKTRDALKRARKHHLVELQEINETERNAEYQSDQEEAMMHAWMLGEVEEALHRIQKDTHVTDKSMLVFRAYMIEGRSAEDVAEEFSMSSNAVYQVKFQYIQRLKMEISRMENFAA